MAASCSPFFGPWLFPGQGLGICAAPTADCLCGSSTFIARGANLTFESRLRPGSFSNVKFAPLEPLAGRSVIGGFLDNVLGPRSFLRPSLVLARGADLRC